MKDKIQSRLEGGPFDGAHGHIDDPPPETIFLRPCGRCGCDSKDGYHYRLDVSKGGECYRLLLVDEDVVAVYRHHLIDFGPVRHTFERERTPA